MGEIRQTRIEDAEIIYELIRKEKKIDCTLNCVRDLIREDNTLSLEMIVDNEIVGGIGAREEGHNSAYLYYLVVSESHRKNGYSKMLMEGFFNEARKKGIKRVALDTPYKEFFEKFGFREAGRLPKWYNEDQIIMFREI